MRKKLYISVLVFAAFGYMAGAQGFDPTVEVSRTYESTLKHTPKPIPDMAVPDSLLRFDLDFDYSVFDRPFKGTGDYKPYLLDLRPQPNAYRGKKLYLKAGLGYTLHPELDFVYSPEVGKASTVNIYANHRSFFGKNRYKTDDLKDVVFTETPYIQYRPSFFISDAEWTGYNSFTKVGVNGTTGLSFGELFYNANYKGIHTKDGSVSTLLGTDKTTTSFNALEAMAGIRGAGNGVNYNLAVSFSIGGDKYNNRDKNLSYTDYGIDGGIGKNLDDSRVALDFHFQNSSYSSNEKAHLGNWYIAPRYIFETDGFRLNLGAKIGSILHSDVMWFGLPFDPNKSQIIYPDAYLAYLINPGELEFYASATGGDKLTNYQQIKERDAFAIPGMTDNSVEHINLRAGLRGNIGQAFRYDVSAGYRNVSGAVMYQFTTMNQRKTCFLDLSEPYFQANLIYDRKPLLIEGNVTVKGSSVTMPDRENDIKMRNVYNDLIAMPRKVTADIKALYYWKSRIVGGITLKTASRANVKGDLFYVLNNNTASYLLTTKCTGYFEGYLDLGLYGEYSVDRMVSVYGRICNLLNQKYYDNTLVPVSGLYATFGLIINL